MICGTPQIVVMFVEVVVQFFYLVLISCMDNNEFKYRFRSTHSKSTIAVL